MEDNVAIRVKDVRKEFQLPHEKRGSIKSLFINMFRKRTYERQQVLKGISFDVKKGEFFGIVGRNGSGKSTMLKTLAGIYNQTKGEVCVNGKLVPFIELGVGFNQDLTGKENVFLNGALLGFTRDEMLDMYDEIISFAELENFMDQKLKNYSSGMQVRLAFSIAIRVKTDILLVDEVLAVGDENFQRKCYDFFSASKTRKTTIVFVSHDMSAVRNFCDRAVLLDKGNIIAEGNGNEIASKYSDLNSEELERSMNTIDEQVRYGDGTATINNVKTLSRGKIKNLFKADQVIEVEIEIQANQSIDNSVVGMIIQDSQDRIVFATNTKEMGVSVRHIKNREKINASFVINNVYPNGKYKISCAIANVDRSKTYSRIENAHEFAVSGRAHNNSSVFPPVEFKLS